MDKDFLTKYTCSPDITIVAAMQKIDDNAKGILFVVDKDSILQGCITDGDIRRWILQTADLHALVQCAMKTDPKRIKVADNYEKSDELFEKGITAIPIIDDNECIVNILFKSDYSSIEVKKKKDLSAIPVVIMAGGKGTRLYPYTKILPKPLIPIGETPIIERIINYYTEYEIKSFYMTVNYKKSMIKSYFSDLNPQYSIKYVEEDQPLGTCGSIGLIEDKLSDNIFVTNCDALIIADYGDIYNYHCEAENDITIVSAVKNITVPYGVINTQKDGEVTSIKEKPHLSYLINTGMYIIKSEVISYIPKDIMYHMTDLISEVMKRGGKVGAYPISEDSFLDMGEFSEMKRTEEKLNVLWD